MADLDAMSFILMGVRDNLRSKNNWKDKQCRISFGTTPISLGVPWFVGIEDLSESNEADEEDMFDRYEYGVQIGVWRNAAMYPNDREGVLLQDADTYLKDRKMLHDLTTCVVDVVKSTDTVQCINDLLSLNSRPNCYSPILSQLRYMGHSKTEIVTSIPSIEVTEGRWARRILQFRGAKQIITR
tara:strand:- start:198 stop:749 length:552 start_codon:yes stop_codon:yes gene_type:complete